MGVLLNGDVAVLLEEERFLGIKEDEGGAGFGGAVDEPEEHDVTRCRLVSWLVELRT